MSTIISVQDIRTSLASLAQRAENGETFTVIRNSKPAFMITPIAAPAMIKEPGTAYVTKADRREAAAPPGDLTPARHPLRQDTSLKGARFVGDPCSPVDERDWPKEAR
jgi:antitoxin (DNA-binding transcriptional repressor) of toxin-antitoxin stability system